MRSWLYPHVALGSAHRFTPAPTMHTSASPPPALAHRPARPPRARPRPQAFAESYMTDGLLSGLVTTRSLDGGAPRGGGGSSLTNRGGGADDVPVWMRNPPPPTPPLLRSYFTDGLPPSPPPGTEPAEPHPSRFDHIRVPCLYQHASHRLSRAIPRAIPRAIRPMPSGASSATQLIVTNVSFAMLTFLGLAFCTCAYCFFREDLLTVAEKASGGKVNMRKRGLRAKYSYDTMPTTEEAMSSTTVSSDAKAGRGKRKAKVGGAKLAAGYANVRLESNGLSQRKEVYIGNAEDYNALRDILWSEFAHVLRSKRMEQMLVLCQAPDGAPEGSPGWQLVSRDSDMLLVISRGSLKLVEKGLPGVSEEALELAFPREDAVPHPPPGGGRAARRAHRSERAAERAAERFTDAPEGQDGAAADEEQQQGAHKSSRGASSGTGRRGHGARGPGGVPAAAEERFADSDDAEERFADSDHEADDAVRAEQPSRAQGARGGKESAGKESGRGRRGAEKGSSGSRFDDDSGDEGQARKSGERRKARCSSERWRSRWRRGLDARTTGPTRVTRQPMRC